ncbi:MAG TPA: PilZ domain-containing protein, partial [Chitinispirillaceae bacterium]|nr:PilZ domain-containing protein [Chitinispirillaceae bacterium]
YMIERRQYQRIDIDLVTVEVYESQQIDSSVSMPEICSVVNISEDGMCFLAEHKFEKKQLVRLTFLLPESIVIIRTDATIAYMTKNSIKDFAIGVQFQNLDPSERKQIGHFISKVVSINTV